MKRCGQATGVRSGRSCSEGREHSEERERQKRPFSRTRLAESQDRQYAEGEPARPIWESIRPVQPRFEVVASCPGTVIWRLPLEGVERKPQVRPIGGRRGDTR